MRTHWTDRDSGELLGLLREAMRTEKAVKIAYADEYGNTSERVIWPIALAYYEEKQLVAAWCTMREDFRNFRTDRIVSAAALETRFGKRRAVLARQWEDVWQAEHKLRYPDQ